MKSLRQFDFGEVTDNDTTDTNDRSCQRLVNFDLDRALGLVRGRQGIATWAGVATISATNEAGTSVGTIPESGHSIKQILHFDSGISSPKRCTFVITEKLTYVNNVVTAAEYNIYSNAPYGGDDNLTGFQRLEVLSLTQGPFECMAESVDGVVYVAASNQRDYRVHYNLYEGRTASGTPDTRKYFNGAVTVNSATMLNNVVGDADTLYFGKGGRIFNGWGYDYGKPYVDGTKQDTVTLNYDSDSLPSGSQVALVPGKYSLFAVIVIDGDPDQFGVPIYATSGSSLTPLGALGYGTSVANFTVSLSNTTTFNRRIKRIDIFCKRSELDDSMAEADFSCCLQIDINTGVAAPFTAAWSSNSVSFVFDARMYKNFVGYFWSQVSGGRGVTHSLADITCKMNGLLAVKERMLAWGTNGDTGQERVRHTSMGWGGRGTRDIWWNLNMFYKEIGGAIKALIQWRGKIVMFYATNSYYFDVAQRQLPTPWPIDEKTNEVGYGVGTELVGTIAASGGGIFMANYDNVYLMRGSEDVPLLTNRKLNAWLAISNENKKKSIGIWYGRRKEYWLLVYNGTSYEVWIWNNRPGEENWRTYTFAVAHTPRYFWIDPYNKLCWDSSAGLVEFEKKSAGDAICDLGSAYTMRLTTQFLDLGDFASNVLYRISLRRKTYSTTYSQALTGAITITLYRDEQTVAIQPTIVIAAPTVGSTGEWEGNSAAVREIGLRASNVQVDIQMTSTATMKEPPEILQLDLLDLPQNRRSN